MLQIALDTQRCQEEAEVTNLTGVEMIKTDGLF